MGRLFHTERGRMLIANNEEVTRWRWVRKELTLPRSAARHDAELWLDLYEYEGNTTPLEVFLNGRPLANLPAQRGEHKAWAWYKLDVPGARVRPGLNRIELRSASPAMNTWALAIEPGHEDPESYLSTDQGRKWRNSDMGAHNALRGEYVIRLLSNSPRLKPDKPPRVVYEDAKHPRVRELLTLIPEEIREIRNPWEQTLKLRSWQSTAWAHAPSGLVYTPWDPWTMLDWGKRNAGHSLKGRIAMCVHFGAMFTSLLAALGHKSRCIVNTRAFNSPDGHFMTEVWSKHHKKWVLHDGNVDTHYEADGVPLSAFDLADRCDRDQLPLDEIIRVGPGYHRQPPHLAAFYENLLRPGVGWKHTGVWTLNDYVSDPTHAPPSHGSVVYGETDFVWYDPCGRAPAHMFPHVVTDRKYFDRSPER
ncbi:MAG: hypothetical protein K8S99_00160 [Planctomycetes bacterium]|nr:hypothetical protein [Planctomycetota bacterium]